MRTSGVGGRLAGGGLVIGGRVPRLQIERHAQSHRRIAGDEKHAARRGKTTGRRSIPFRVAEQRQRIAGDFFEAGLEQAREAGALVGRR